MLYLFAMACFAAIIMTENYRRDNEVTDRLKNIRADVKELDRNFCETINNIYRVRGFELIDCDDSQVIVIPKNQKIENESDD